MSDPRTHGTINDDRQTGVYKITNLVDGKRYVGSAGKSFKKRWQTHRNDLRNGKHFSRHLQYAWNKHGEQAFVFEIVERTAPHHAVAIEQTFIDYWKSADPKHGYNICPTAGSQRGLKRSPETKAKIALSKLNLSDESRAKMSAAKLGKRATPETRRKISEGHKGIKHTIEARAKMSALWRPRNNTAETFAKMSVAKLGKPLPEEHRRKISEAFKGRKQSHEHSSKRIASTVVTKLIEYAAKWDTLTAVQRLRYLKKHGNKTAHQRLEELKRELQK